MSAAMPKDIVIDVNVMCLYDTKKRNKFTPLFFWLREKGSLVVGPSLLQEYGGSRKNAIMVLINELHREGRYDNIVRSRIKSFKEDRHFKYTCNFKDQEHAKVVFLSYRKKLVTLDNNLRADVNKFNKVDGIKPSACNNPVPAFYK